MRTVLSPGFFVLQFLYLGKFNDSCPKTAIKLTHFFAEDVLKSPQWILYLPTYGITDHTFVPCWWFRLAQHETTGWTEFLGKENTKAFAQRAQNWVTCFYRLLFSTRLVHSSTDRPTVRSSIAVQNAYLDLEFSLIQYDFHLCQETSMFGLLLISLSVANSSAFLPLLQELIIALLNLLKISILYIRYAVNCFAVCWIGKEL